MTGPELQYFRKSVLGLSQPQFAARYHLVAHTIALWEQGHRAPTGPALVLLQLIRREPELVAAILAKPAP